tara:strand:+ start:540 stop:1034 length:495 start_codon:yes stop_codon:yes gene_type:complete
MAKADKVTKVAKVVEVTSWNTAIKRKKPSAPLSLLILEALLEDSVLDYGCGRGGDLKHLQSIGHSASGYDPHWGPKELDDKEYSTILCTYVLNVLSENEADYVVSDIERRLAPGGTAFITVRRDLTKEGKTTKGFQRNVVLDLPIHKEKKGQYCMYKVTRPTGQ